MWNRLRWRLSRFGQDGNDDQGSQQNDPSAPSSSASDNSDGTSKAHSSSASPSPYYPSSRHDVYHAAFLLRQRLVADLVPRILDEAEYWTVRTQRTDMAPRITEAARGQVILATDPPISHEESRWVRRVVLSVRSKDQGWGGNPADRDTERGSWTWFEAHVKKQGQRWHRPGDMAPEERNQQLDGEKIELVDEPEQSPYDEEADDNDPRPRAAPPRPRNIAPWEGPRLLTNLTASQTYRTQQAEWRADDETVGPDGQVVGEKVRGLREGDRIALTAHAIFPGWANLVSWAEMQIYVAHVR